MKVTAAITILALMATAPSMAATMYVTSEDGLRLRGAPSLDADIIDVVGFADEVSGDLADGWFKTEDGYLKAEYLSEKNPLDGCEYLGTWRVTAYAETGNACANGEYPEVGETIAHNSLPFGTKVYIEGVGVRTVEDRGPAYLGDAWCDLYLGYVWDCITWGNRYRDVWIMEMP